jgi:hypothetical protein
MPEENSNKTEKKPDIVIPRDTKFGEYEIPEQLKVWDSPNSYSKEYGETMEDLSAICDYIAKLLNEGPEIKESVAKRMLTLRAVMKTIIMKTFCNNFNRIGLLQQMIFDIQYEQQMKIALAAYQRQMQAQEAIEKEKGDTYVD